MFLSVHHRILLLHVQHMTCSSSLLLNKKEGYIFKTQVLNSSSYLMSLPNAVILNGILTPDVNLLIYKEIFCLI